MRKLIFTFFAFTILNTATFTMAKNISANQIYKIDIVIFRTMKIDTIQKNLFHNPNLDNLAGGRTLEQLNQINPNYHILPTIYFNLNTPMERLNQSGLYQVLIQQAWIQPINKNYKILIHAGQNYDNNLQELLGTLQISRTAYQYLKLTAEFNLTEPTTQGLQSINLAETRRILPNQLNYLDTPAFGMLIIAKPYEKVA